jgi:alpha-tubulin suppressor-like RCC1 family protein
LLRDVDRFAQGDAGGATDAGSSGAGGAAGGSGSAGAGGEAGGPEGCITAVDGQFLHTCAVRSDGTLWCWGYNFYGQLGDGTKTDRATPTRVENFDLGVVSVSAAFGHSCAIKNDDTLWCWGDNASGQLGIGTKVDQPAPVKVLDGVRYVSADGSGTCAIKLDGSAWCWGYNGLAAFPIDDSTCSDCGTNDKCCLSPRPVTTLNPPVLGIATGLLSSCAWWQDGAAQCSDLAEEFANLVGGVAQVATGAWHNCMRTKSGEAWCWNAGGPSSLARIDDAALSGIVDLDAGREHSCAATPNGAWCWGSNACGQLGDGSPGGNCDGQGSGAEKPPRKAADLVGPVTDIATGSDHTCALSQAGQLWCWGRNNYGQLGRGEASSYETVPRLVDIPCP